MSHRDSRLHRFAALVSLGVLLVAFVGVATLVARQMTQARHALTPASGSCSTGNSQWYVAPTGNDTTGDGSQANPWATVAHAAQYLGNGSGGTNLAPGSTIHVAPGTYNEAQSIVITGSMTVSCPLAVLSDIPRAAHIVGSCASTVVKVIDVQASYVDIDGFDVSSQNTTNCYARAGILMEGSYSRAINNKVHDLPGYGCGVNGAAGIDASTYTAGYDDMLNNIVYNIGAVGSCTSGVNGLYQANLGGKVYNNIVYNILPNNGGTGIATWHSADGGWIANNLVFNTYDGIEIGDDSGCDPNQSNAPPPGGPYPANCAENFQVANNIVAYNTGHAINEYPFYSPSIPRNPGGNYNTYTSNFLFGNCGGTGAGGTLGCDKVELADGSTYSPNCSPTKCTANTYPGFVSQSTYVNGPKLTYPNTLTSIFVNWQLNGTGDYHLKAGSVCIDNGTTIGPNYDLDGNLRPRGTKQDLGPYEYQG